MPKKDFTVSDAPVNLAIRCGPKLQRAMRREADRLEMPLSDYARTILMIQAGMFPSAVSDTQIRRKRKQGGKVQ